MGRVFISYSRVDQKFARSIAAELSAHGFDVWLDVEDIPSGMNWSNAIQQGLDTADAMILILTPDSMASENVANEWQYFLDHGKPLIPLLLRQTKMHFQLHRIQYVNFVGTSFASAFKKLLVELQSKGIHPSAEQVLSEKEKRTEDTSPPAQVQRLWIAAFGLAIVALLVFGAISILPSLGAIQATPTVEMLYFPIRDETEFVADLNYEVTLSGIFAGTAFADVPVRFNVLGMEPIEGTVDFTIPENALVNAVVTGVIPVDQSIPIALDARLGFRDDVETVTVIAGLNINDTVFADMDLPMSISSTATVHEPVVISLTDITLQLNDGTLVEGNLFLTFPTGLQIPLELELYIPVSFGLDIQMDVTNSTQFPVNRVPASIQVSDSLPLEFFVPFDAEVSTVITQDVPISTSARFEPGDGSSALEGQLSVTFPVGTEFTVHALGSAEGTTDIPINITIPTNPESILPEPSPVGFGG